MDSALFEDISPSKDGGVLKTITRHGNNDSGMPSSGCKVHVHYVGRLENGENFDSSRDRGKLFSFSLGDNTVIKGWEIGVATMHKNEICELKIAPEYGYGEKGFPPKIPEKATLIFEIELVSWDEEEVTSDKGVTKRILKEGDSLNKPNLDASVKVHLRGSYKGRLFDERDVEFVIGDGYEVDIIDGIELALCKMKRHEKARVFINAKYAFKEKGSEKFDIPPNADAIEYEVCLFNFEKAKELYEMDYDQKLEKAQVLKERALKCIKVEEYAKANEQYTRILKFVTINKEDSDYKRGLPFKIAATSNAAFCYLKLGDFHNACIKSEKVLKLDSKNVKGYFRLGEANIGLREYEKAIKAFEDLLKIEPDNTAAKKQINYCRQLLKKQVEKEKKLYGIQRKNGST
ncbi:peptidyl-prolyl cis-trans isomerase FKBP5-like [Hydractinia symbiolongicarpus]|uniref:peptidyl-prolyl cis-trans isomerase FKBP5-like n=1 Tax=Hydractinia symbiolongicarpus TaxID=13093 RepID=UPI00254AF9F3|nr:peptidyl-prolyl cis-trans isomerase FKBP5-like [Hydractinia symbiolongicarpus]